jgi:site-specific DNA recombinase
MVSNYYKSYNIIMKNGSLIHCRVSSNKQSQEGESHDVQEGACVKIASGLDSKVLKIWRETFSGRKTIRPVFEEIIDFIKSHPGEVKYYIIRSIDRVTRGGSYSYEEMKMRLAKLGVEMIDSYNIIQPAQNTLNDLGFEYSWSKYSPSKVSELMHANSAKDEVTNILTRMIGQEIRLTQKGFKIRGAADGFKNEKIYIEGKKRTIEVADPVRSKYFIEIFNMRASGLHTDAEIVERINAMGYRSRLQNKWNENHTQIIGRSGGIPLTVKQLQKLVQRPIYCGVMIEVWTNQKPIRASYDGLVSIQKFNEANRGKIFIKENSDKTLEVFYDYYPEKIINKRTKNNTQFPYKNVITCPICKKPFLGSSSKGKSGKKFPAYHCSRNHKYFRVDKLTLEDNVSKFIRGLKFKPGVLKALQAVFIDRYREKQAEMMGNASQIGHSVADLETEKAAAFRAFISATSPVVKEGMEMEIERLDKEIKEAQSVRNKLEITEADITRFIEEVKFIMEHPSELLINPTSITQQQNLYALVFDEFPDYSQILNGTPKLSWIFKLSSEFAHSKSQLVTLQRIEL